MAILVLCLKPVNLLDPNPAFVSFGNRLTISPVVERLVFSKARSLQGPTLQCCRPVALHMVYSFARTMRRHKQGGCGLATAPACCQL